MPTTKTPPNAARMERQHRINGTLPEPAETIPVVLKPREMVKITEPHGIRWVRVAAITHVIDNPGMLGGPYFIRVDGHQMRVSDLEFAVIAAALGLELPRK